MSSAFSDMESYFHYLLPSLKINKILHCKKAHLDVLNSIRPEDEWTDQVISLKSRCSPIIMRHVIFLSRKVIQWFLQVNFLSIKLTVESIGRNYVRFQFVLY